MFLQRQIQHRVPHDLDSTVLLYVLLPYIELSVIKNTQLLQGTATGTFGFPL